MPRVSSKDSIETPKRAPRRQIVRKVGTTTPRSPRVRRSPVNESLERASEADTVIRKAPTKVLEKGTGIRISRKIYVSTAIFIVVLMSAVWIGVSDNGQINVSTKIEERNAQIAKGEFTADNSSGSGGSQIIPVQSSAPNIPNGGLKGRGVGTANTQQQASVATASTTEESTASTTEATSTEAVTNNEVSADTNSNNTESNTGTNSGSETDNTSATPEASQN
jgi:hypothetical protein